MNRKKKLLVVLLIMLAISLGYRIMNPFKQQRVEKLTYDSGLRTKVARKISKSRPELKEPRKKVLLALLKTPPAHNGNAQSNMFSDNKQAGLASTRPGATPAARQKAEPDAGPVRPTEEIFEAWRRFTPFGTFQSEKDMVLFLERGKEVLAVRQGDKIDGRFEIVKLTPKSITLKDHKSKKTAQISLDDL